MSQVIVILDSNTLSVSDWYFSNSPFVPVTPGIRLEVPEGLMWDTIKGALDETTGFLSLVEDPAKVQAKLDAAWAALRAERNRRLAACDWVGLADAHVSQERKDAWFTYRQALRDLPEAVTDPRQVGWPAEPGAQVVPVSGTRLDNILGQV